MSNKKQRRIYSSEYGDGNGSSQYELFVTKSERNDYRITMEYYEHDHQWTNKCRGKAAAKLKDDGNGVVIKFKDGGPKIKLDYSQFEELRLLLTYANDDSEMSDFPGQLTKLAPVE